ncbi:MAG: UDP-N-acetylmuramyl peptide synthase, partial [Gemmatimonadota bacterium]|nr:UDP-N-acetylmuramyl peptide synthase [Gemmatimonadota bacterium]
ERSAAIHGGTLARVLRAGIDRYVLTGAFARAARCYPDDRIDLVEGVDELAERLPGLARPGDTLLLKASRGVRLERAIPALESSYGGRAD